MSDYSIMKALDFAKLPVKTKKRLGSLAATAALDNYQIQPKYDGCFGVAIVTAKDSSGIKPQMYSRTDENYSVSCQAILDELVDAVADSDETWVFLGEVWHPTWNFQTISGKFRQQKEVCKELVFMVHDVITHDEYVAGFCPTPYKDRLASVYNFLPSLSLAEAKTHAVPSHVVPSSGAEAYAADLKRAKVGHYDGAMLKDMEAPWTRGDAKEGQLIKVKPSESLDLEVVAWKIEPGEKTGREVVTIEVKLPNDKTCWVGSGVPHDYRPKVGEIVEIEFMGYTAAKLLREPRFKGVRFDKLQPD